MLRAESDALAGLPHMAVAVYVTVLRPIKQPCGRVVGLSWRSIGEAVAMRDRGGIKSMHPTIAKVRHAVGKLVAAGLVRLTTEARSLTLQLPLAPNSHEVIPMRPNLPPDPPAGPERETAKITDQNGAAPRLSLVPQQTSAADQDGPNGSPPVSPLSLSPLNPLSLSPLLTPPPSHAHAETPDTAQRITATWAPLPDTILALRQKGISEADALAEVGHFRLYWSQAPKSTGRKKPGKWQLAFVNWCLGDQRRAKAKALQQTMTKDETHATSESDRRRDRDRGAAGRQADAIQEYFAGRATRRPG